MSNSVTRTHSGDRFYNPPAFSRQLQMQLQSQLHRSLETDSDESTLWRTNSVCSASTPRTANLTNLDRLMESVTPRVQYFSEARRRGWETCEADKLPFFCLGDLWESFKEWSVYGVGVPLLLNGSDSVKQYYVPFLSGIQLYIDPQRLRRPGDDSDADSSRETSSAGSSDYETERRAKGSVDGMWGHHNLMNLNSQRMNRLTLRDKPPMSSSSDDADNSHGLLIFEYFEQEQPHHRKPLYDKVSSLTSQFPGIRMYRSCDLLPSSWVSVAWYPIYRIPLGQTLQNLDASFLTFHPLSTHSRSKNQLHFDASSSRKVYGVVDASSKISLPVFGLASYKLRGSILAPNGAHEWQQANSLLQAADNWLRCLQANLPDFQFFASHNSQWR